MAPPRVRITRKEQTYHTRARGAVQEMEDTIVRSQQHCVVFSEAGFAPYGHIRYRIDSKGSNPAPKQTPFGNLVNEEMDIISCFFFGGASLELFELL